MTHRETGYVQALLTVLFLAGYFFTLRAFLQGKAIVSPDWKETIQALVSVLTAGVLQVINYWFARQRASNDPQQKETTT